MRNHSSWPSTDDYLNFILSSLRCDHIYSHKDDRARARHTEPASAKTFDLLSATSRNDSLDSSLFRRFGSNLYELRLLLRLHKENRSMFVCCRLPSRRPRTSNQSIYKMVLSLEFSFSFFFFFRQNRWWIESICSHRKKIDTRHFDSPIAFHHILGIRDALLVIRWIWLKYEREWVWNMKCCRWQPNKNGNNKVNGRMKKMC